MVRVMTLSAECATRAHVLYHFSTRIFFYRTTVSLPWYGLLDTLSDVHRCAMASAVLLCTPSSDLVLQAAPQ